MWYNKNGPESDVVLSTRVRIARNLAGYPFPGKMNVTQTDEIIGKVKEAFALDGWECVDFEEASREERAAMLEKHLVSREFVMNEGARVLLKNESKSVYVMTPEEDHLRIQSILPGFDVDGAMASAFEAEEAADKKLGFAYSERYGYITHCPTNLGTGLRISVMLHLPAYTESGAIRSLSHQLDRIGMTIRGMDGEGSRPAAALYQISNETTLGTSEEETRDKLVNIVEQIVKNERELRSKMSDAEKDNLSEKVRRDYGILMYCGRLNTAELVSMYSDMRYASALGLCDISPEKLDEMLIRSLPNTVMTENGGIKAPEERDKKRADTVRSILQG